MKRFFSFLCVAFMLLAFSAPAQNLPKGPVADRIVKAYRANDVNGVVRELVAYKKAYPGDPYGKFFQAWSDQYSGKDPNISLRLYSELIKSNPKITDPYVYRATLFQAKGMTDRAISDMDAAIRIEGENTPAFYYSVRADLHFQNKDYEQAFGDFMSAIRISPDVARYYTGLSNMGDRLGKNAAVQQVFEAALTVTQKSNPAVYASYGEHLSRRQDYNKSLAQYKQAFASPDFQPSSDDYNVAGIAAYKLKDYTLAKKYMEQGIAAFPKDITLHINRASVAIDQSDWQQVYAYAQKALAIDNEDAMANMLMAVGVKKTGRGDALSAQYERKGQEINQRTGAYR